MNKNAKTAFVYTAILVAAALAWIPFSHTQNCSMLWISGAILAPGSAWALRELRMKNSSRKHRSMAVRKLEVSAVLTLLFGLFLIVYSFL